MNLTRFALEKRVLTQFVVFLFLVGGLYSYTSLGRLEDPDFTVKVGVIITQYPGASAEEVELEVTDRIEKALQEMPQLDTTYSISRAGLSIIKVDMKQKYWADTLPQVWDEMRKKIRDVLPSMPAGVLHPEIVDDFSFVFGFVLAVTGDGYSYSELEDHVKLIKKELSLVRGVSRVELWGVQPKVIYLDVSETQLASLKITQEDVLATLALQNMVVSGGFVEVPGRRLRVEVADEFKSPEDIGELVIRRSLEDVLNRVAAEIDANDKTLSAMMPIGVAASGSSKSAKASEVIRLKDIATIRPGYLEPSMMEMRHQGKSALAVQVANVAGGNLLETGAALDKRLEEVIAELPAGINVEKFTWQSDLVKESIDGFVINLAEAVLIVLVVLTLAMGWRMGVVIGWALILTIFGTFVVMKVAGIDLQRVSLGALVVALGMMVDNAIVVADNYTVRLAKGMKPKEAAIDSAQGPSIALLGATIVAIMAFYPVFAAKADAGEYGRTLFLVVGVSLIISWLISMTVTPMNCIALIKPSESSGDNDAYSSGFFQRYKRLLEGAIRMRGRTIGFMTILLVASIIGFAKYVPQQFFPDSTRAQFMIDYWAPQGTPIQDVSANLALLEQRLINDERVKDVGTFIGAGGPRFYLPVDPEFPYPEFGQLIVNTPSYAEVNELVDELRANLPDQFPEAMIRVRKYTVGLGDTWPFELRISGPAEADLGELRRLGEEGMAILNATPLAQHVRIDMRQQTPKLVVDYSQERGRWSAATRADIGQATSRAYDGTLVGIFRSGDTTQPIIARNSETERQLVAGNLDTVQVQTTLGLKTVPLGQLTDGNYLEWEDPIITRFNRRRQVAIQGAPADGVTFPALRAEVKEQFDNMELPPGYSIFWDGEYDNTTRAQLSLVPGMVPGSVIMILIIVALFNAIRPPIVMLLTVPFALIGITAILAPTQTAFGFMALLGAMSLVGLMIKNSIVLLDEINVNAAAGMNPYDSVVAAGLSRVRPVVLGAATTILGVIPLIQDAFWVSMALTMMFGLLVGTVLTMVLVPTFYALLYGIKSPAKER
ncbi:MAG: RND transporter permease [Cellvibrionaceae bacterium]|nr:RND transporter permease [Cellvibrionaceae bacterium]|tara:strand:- start:1162 stop:4335 length:3174 start_codon:yes stop_codon:yes gene_type:complete